MWYDFHYMHFPFYVVQLPLLPLYMDSFFCYYCPSIVVKCFYIHFNAFYILSISWVSFPFHWIFSLERSEMLCMRFFFSFLWFSNVPFQFSFDVVLCVPIFRQKKLHFILAHNQKNLSQLTQFNLYKFLWHAAYHNTYFGFQLCHDWLFKSMSFRILFFILKMVWSL